MCYNMAMNMLNTGNGSQLRRKGQQQAKEGQQIEAQPASMPVMQVLLHTADRQQLCNQWFAVHKCRGHSRHSCHMSKSQVHVQNGAEQRAPTVKDPLHLVKCHKLQQQQWKVPLLDLYIHHNGSIHHILQHHKAAALYARGCPSKSYRSCNK